MQKKIRNRRNADTDKLLDTDSANRL